METIIRIDGFDVECKEFSLLASDNEGQSGVGTEDVPEDVAKESEYSSEGIKSENEEEDADHTLSSICRRFFFVA